MPHQCTNCGRSFADGSTEMLSGCPDCGGNKFQFAPAATAGADPGDGTGGSSPSPPDGAAEASDPLEGGGTDAPGSDGVASRAAETVRDWVSNGSPDRADAGTEEFAEWPETARRPEDRSDSGDEAGGDDETEWPDRTPDGRPATPSDDENSAQADARSEVVSSEDIPPRPTDADPDRSTSDPGPESDGADPPADGRVVSEPSGEQPSIEELRAELNEQFESIKIVRPGQYELNLMELYNRDEYIISLQEDGRYVIDVPDSWREDDDA